MKFLLRLKHWQLFLLTWGFPIIVDIWSLFEPKILFELFTIMMVFFTIGLLGWVWAIATVLNNKLNVETKLNLRIFKIIFSIPIVYIIAIISWIKYDSYTLQYESSGGAGASDSSIGLSILPFIIVVHLMSLVFIMMGLRFAAKTLKSVELGRQAKFADYVGEFFLIWFSPVGIWILQPRLNKLVK